MPDIARRSSAPTRPKTAAIWLFMRYVIPGLRRCPTAMVVNRLRRTPLPPRGSHFRGTVWQRAAAIRANPDARCLMHPCEHRRVNVGIIEGFFGKPWEWSARADARSDAATVIGAPHTRRRQGHLPRVFCPASARRGGGLRYMASNDPDFETKAADIVGCYLNPPAHPRRSSSPSSPTS